MKAESAFPFVDAGRTDHRGLGLAIGEQLREPIRAQCDKTLDLLLAHRTHEALPDFADAFLVHGAAAFPEYLAEIDGMAVGAGVEFDRMLLTFCEETSLNAAREQCTTIAFADGDCLLLGHNEDWSPGYEESLYIVRATMPNGTTFLSLAYIGSLPGSSVALNSHGIAFSGNSILGTHQQGAAKNLILRSQVDARSLEDFERRATHAPRAIPNNTMALDRWGHMIDIELALDRHALLRAVGRYFVHTNHVLSPELRRQQKLELPGSEARYETARAMAFNGPRSTELMKQILRSHERWPRSVCVHAHEANRYLAQTIAAAIVDLSEMTLSVANGPPCQHEFVTFQLAA